MDELTSVNVLDDETFLSMLVFELIILRATKIKEGEEEYVFYSFDIITLITRKYSYIYLNSLARIYIYISLFAKGKK